MEERTSSPSPLPGATQESAGPATQLSAERATLHTPLDSTTSLSASTKKSHPKRATSAANSPLASRDSSPVRPLLKPNSSSARSSGASRSRKNSAHDVSPSRAANNITNPPSAAATQRALSAASIPALHPVPSEPALKTPVAVKANSTTEIKDTPRWPISPRLRSPPPINKHSATQPRKIEQDPPAINVPRTTSGTESQETKQTATDSEDDSLLVPGMRTPARGASGSTLETVQEISLPNTPGQGLDGILEKAHSSRLTEQDNVMDNAFNKSLKSKGSTGANESGSESGGKGETKMRSASVVPVVATRPNGPTTKSFGATTGVGKGKAAGDGTARNMTVETETVSSIPQVAVGVVGPGNNGSIRNKPSSETIRPKKEKKKTARKAPSTSGAASSKADIFEAKVASAVDEANSSDSEETFVYESNPPDNNDRPRRFHSRTPSVTSMASQVDQRNGARMDGGHSVAMKKSMKFANSYNSNGPEPTATEDDGKGTARSSIGTGRGTTHHHHIGRFGRNGGNGHPSLFDNESPFPNAAKAKLSGGTGPRYSSQPISPRMAGRMALNGKKSSPISSGYDMEDGADDERTPLLSSVRSGRSGRARRPAATSMRQLEHQASRQNRSFVARFAGCLVLTVMIILVLSGAVGFMFATTQPLSWVKIVALRDVLASEQELIFNLKVQASNPNLVVVTIDLVDLDVFAKSKYAGTDSEWWKMPPVQTRRRKNGVIYRRDDDPRDPPLDGDNPDGSPNFGIGNVLELDSPLTFDASPFRHKNMTSIGQIRISHPANDTLPRGSERWGRIVQHEFDLIVRGTLKYTLPLSQKIHKVEVNGRVLVRPNAADDPDNLHRLPNLTD